MENKYASICVLSYQRLDFLKRMMASLLSVDSGYNMEIIVSDDGSEPEVKDYLYSLLKEKKISYLILNGGKNRGIGTAVRNCFKVASGDYLFKLDTDIEVKRGWLREAVNILEQPMIGSVSLLDYNNYNPDDDRFEMINQYVDGNIQYKVVTDFISCLYGVKREIYEKYKNQLGTDGWHQYIKSQGYDLAISAEDKIVNFGFGLKTSIYLDVDKNGNIVTRKTHKRPLIFGEKSEGK